MIVSSSPFGADGYNYIYKTVKRDIHLGSPSGGTGSHWVRSFSANPISPVWAGEIQGPALGFNIEIFDETGRPIKDGAGELVVTRPFPVDADRVFWNDSDGSKYRNAYFNHFPNVWRHGDWARLTEHGGVVIFGRSDATLNARGIRVGTAEIYRQLGAITEIADAVAVSQEWDGDTRIVLFVKMRDGEHFDTEMVDRIRKRIRENLSPRHVPDKILSVPEIPLTSTGKISEAAVQAMIHGKRPANEGTLANPDALKHFAPEVLTELMH